MLQVNSNIDISLKLIILIMPSFKVANNKKLWRENHSTKLILKRQRRFQLQFLWKTTSKVPWSVIAHHLIKFFNSNNRKLEVPSPKNKFLKIVLSLSSNNHRDMASITSYHKDKSPNLQSSVPNWLWGLLRTQLFKDLSLVWYLNNKVWSGHPRVPSWVSKLRQ